MPSRRRQRPVQQPLVFSRRGGARVGAGRPKDPHAGVSHLRRTRLSKHQPVHVTLKVRGGLPNLRSPAPFRAIRASLQAARGRFGSICHFSVQRDHLHLLFEAQDAHALARAIQGLCIRIAKARNRALGRAGRVFADRYHAHVLRTPTEVRRALHYVIHNRWKHGSVDRNYLAAVDYCSSLHFRVELTLPPRSYLLCCAEPQVGIAAHPLAAPGAKVPV